MLRAKVNFSILQRVDHQRAIATLCFGVAVFLTLSTSPASAAQIKAELISQSDAPQSPRVAESFWLRVTVATEQDQRVVFPEVPDNVGEFQVVSHRDWFDVPIGHERTWTRNLELRSFVGGELEIPAMQASVDGQLLSSNPIPITIVSSVEENANLSTFRDIKKPIEIPAEPDAEQPNWAMWLAGGLLLAGAIALAVRAWLPTRRKSQTAEAWAREQLDQIRNSEPFQHTDATTARTLTPEIADVLREYIERRFFIRATRQTTEEFLRSISADRSAMFSETQRSTIDAFLKHADQIKFAAHVPDEKAAHKSLKLVEEFVQANSEEQG